VLRVPHPIPYQGSKRRLAVQILSLLPTGAHRLIEPFGGSAAVTLAAAARRSYERYLIADALAPLAGIWHLIMTDPGALIASYERLWRDQLGNPRDAYDQVRTSFNETHEPAALLYLLARCVKASVRFNGEGKFNQSPDNRRLGMRPSILRSHVMAAHALLNGHTEVRAADFRETLADATSSDVVYMDPPYQGVSGARDRRYAQAVSVHDLTSELERLNRKQVPFVLSYDGTCGDRSYGEQLPADLGLRRVPAVWGRSAQSTLSGRAETTVESLYVSPRAQLDASESGTVVRPDRQITLSV